MVAGIGDATSTSGLSTSELQEATEIIATHQGLPGAALPVLHALQQRFGFIPAQTVPLIAAALNLSRAEVHGVLTFYHDFRQQPPGRHILKLCRAEACQALGAEGLAKELKQRLGLEMGADQRWRRAHARAGVLPGAVRLRTGRIIRRQAGGPARRLAAGDTGHSGNGMNSANTTRIYVPRDAAAIAVGADRVATAILALAARRNIAIELVRNGSRGMFWLEPFVEVATPGGRIGYGPVAEADVEALFDAGFIHGGPHSLRQGVPEQLAFLKQQQRLVFARCGVTDPASLPDYRAHGGLEGLTRALSMPPATIIEEVVQSGLRGRGGAGFPTGIKWRTVAQAAGEHKYIVCNADEGDSGTYADRMIMEGDPFVLIEGMTIASLATGASQGYIYVRSEYPDAIATLRAAIATARAAGVLGKQAGGSTQDFDIEVRVGAGAYVCGEETAMLESLEGRRGMVRAKPPLPAHAGLFGQPTVINNVISLASVPAILAQGAAAYNNLGSGRSRGTMPWQLAGNVRFGGLFEAPFGLLLGHLVDDIGGGTLTGRPVRAVQVGGPLGAYFPRALFDTALDYEAFTAQDGLVGHGGVVVFDDRVDLAAQARFAMEFCAIESCGKCTPCRIGSTRGVEVIDRIVAGRRGGARAADPAAQLESGRQIALLQDLCNTMKFGSLCALGGFVPYPVMSALKHFAEDFQSSGRAATPAGV